MNARRFLSAICAVVVAVSTQCYSQNYIRQFEVGAQSTVLGTFGQTDWCAMCTKAHWSLGGLATYNLNRHFAIDGAFSFFPGPPDNPSWQVGGNITQALVGLKASVHGSRFSLFAKARLGYIRWSRGQVASITFAPGTPDPPVLIGDDPIYTYKARTNFALDLGGGIQFAITPKLSLRTEMGDTMMVWHHYSNNFWDPPPLHGGLSHNVQMSNALLYQFGSTIRTEAASVGNRHKFLDRTNVALLSASLLAQTADAITTQRFMANCRRNLPPTPYYGCEQKEANPIARPFVGRGWGGQIALGAIVNTVQVSVKYTLHHMGHHRIERVVTIPLTIGSAEAAYHNLQ